jgi:hypothetical protein
VKSLTRAMSGPLPAASWTGTLSRIDLYGISSIVMWMSALSFMNRSARVRVAGHSLPSE